MRLVSALVLTLVTLGPRAARAQDECPIVAPDPCASRTVSGFATRLRAGGPSDEAGRVAADELGAASDVATHALSAHPVVAGEAREARERLRALLRRYSDLDTLALGGARPAWPTQYGVRYMVVELSWTLGEGDVAMREAGALLARWPDGDARIELLNVIVLAANNQTQLELQERLRARGRARRGRGSPAAEAPDLAPRPLTPAARAFIETASQLICADPNGTEVTALRYRAAYLQYEAHRFAEAAGGFRVIALQVPEHELAEYAANLYLDSLYLLSQRAIESRPICREALGGAVEPLRALYCHTEAAAAIHADVCQVLEQLGCREALRAALALAGASRHAEAATAYEAMEDERSRCERGDERLHDAGQQHRAAGHLDDAIRVSQRLVRRFPESHFARGALARIGADADRLNRAAVAAAARLQIARRFPAETTAGCSEEAIAQLECIDARLELRRAIEGLVRLGETASARAAVALYERNYGRTDSSGAASLRALVAAP